MVAAIGQTAATSVAAQGDGLTYQWYYKRTDMSSFKASSTQTAADYSLVMKSVFDGMQIYCVITDAYGNTVTSSTVTLHMG